MIGKLNTIPLENVNGVGKTRKIIFNSHKIYSTYDLVTIIPKNYHDYIISDIKNAKNGEIISVVGSIHDSISIIKGKTMYKISFLLSCKNEDVDIILFRSEVGFYNNFKKGDNVLVKGKYFFYERKIIANEIKKYNENTKKIIPIYKIETLPDSIIQEIIETIFKEKKVTIIENLPKKLLLKNNIISREQMYKNLHCPPSFSDIDSSIYRLKYEEALLMEYDIISKRRTLKREKITFDMTKVKHFISKIGFELTSEQKE
ncbi:MAG: hypothetical protein LBV51_02300, partial [Acholeplasmatales bacterium]|nr:hypothetical protein [Acholeplasmatales bacterium]